MADTLTRTSRKANIAIAMMIILCQLGSCQAGQCDAPLSRQAKMVKTAVNQLLATPLSNVTVKSGLHCQSQCLAVDACAYITFSQSTNTCTLYSTATTSVSVAAALQVYAYDTKSIGYSDPSCYPCASNPCQHNGTCTNVFSPDAQYTCTCISPYNGIQCQNSGCNSPSAFYVGSAVTIDANTANIVFDAPVITTVCSPYNVTSKTVTSVAESGVYWFQLAVGVPANTQTLIRLRGLPYPVAVVTSTTNYPYDVMVTDTIQYVNASSQLTVSNTYSVFGTSSNFIGMGTSVLGYRLDNIMSTQVYFSVQCTATSIPTGAKVTYDRVLINVGNAWSKGNNEFTAPYDGNYFFSYATGVSSGYIQTAIFLRLNGVAVGTAYVNDGLHNNIIMARSATMLQLSANAVVSYFAQSAGNYYGSTNGLINAQGFLYSPLGGAAAAVAWCLKDPAASLGPATIVPFARINVNLQGVWNSTAKAVIIPVAGTYFIDLTTYLRGYANGNGCGNGNNVVQVILNTQPVITLQLVPFTSGDSITRSRSIIANLNVGDQLYFSLLSGTCIAGGDYTQFSGFRLF